MHMPGWRQNGKHVIFHIIWWLPAAMAAAVVLLLLAAKIAGPMEIPRIRPAVFYDNRGKAIGKLNGTLQQWVPIRHIAPPLKLATLAIEDRRFFHHHGFDVRRIVSSASADLRSLSKAQGASTITMQYAKNRFLSNDKTWARKATEVFYTLRLEMNESKQRIFEGYLNTIYYGHGAYGIEAAAQTYFNKKAANLSLAESSMLAGIPNGPGLYSPLLHYDQAKKRQRLVLKRMVECGYLSKQRADAAYREPLNFAHSRVSVKRTAPYFQDAANKALKKIPGIGRKELESGGLRVYTTLDEKEQQAAERWIAQTIPASSQLQAALVAMNPQTGAVTAMVGGRNYRQSPFNRATDAKRAPGSAFKPFLYYAALRNGFTPSTRLKSIPTAFTFDDGRGSYTPNNFGGYYADGPITLAQALALSDNVFAVKTHLSIGMDHLVSVARRAGITSPLEAIPSLALGSKPVGVLELTRGYATLAGGGAKVRPALITKVTDQNGRILYQRQPVREQVLNRQTTFVLSQMMTGIFDKRLNGYTTVTGAPVANRLTHTLAAKTGSTATDSWMAGFTPDLVAAVWVGYDKAKTIDTYPDTGYAKTIWSHFIETALANRPKNSFKAPSGVVRLAIDPKTGLRADGSCPGRPTYFIKGTEPALTCNGTRAKTHQDRKPPHGLRRFFERILEWWK